MATDSVATDARRAHGFHRLRVKEVVTETGDAASLVLDVPADLRVVFSYRAGQFCTFRVRIDGQEHLRSYSMSSAPETDADLRLTVKRVPGGLVSNWLLDHLSAGAEIETTRPAGVFCLGSEARPVLAFCGGSGVTPVMSLAKSALATTGRPVHLVYANRDRRSIIFEDALGALTRAYPERLRVHHHIDADSGFLDGPAVAGLVEGRLDAEFYICGPGPFMDLVETTLVDLGVAGRRIHIERFTADAPTAAGTGTAQPGGTPQPGG
ncbi:MAG: FAD-binding oxidoreductase, partial [Actinomycetota bacterium]|nr:FAD-binding oxidoreductase [Actinomycetota bacterium]